MRAAVVLALLFCPAIASADLVVGYTVSANTQPVAPSAAVGVTGISLMRGAGLTNGAATTDFVTAGWDNPPTADDYIEFGFSLSATPWDLTQIQLRTNRSGTGPSSIDLQASINGGAFASVGGYTQPQAATNFTIPLSATNVTSAVFRLIGSGSSSSGGTYRIEDDGNFIGTTNDLVLEGVTAVPEPAAFLFGLVVCGAIAVRYGRRFIG